MIRRGRTSKCLARSIQAVVLIAGVLLAAVASAAAAPLPRLLTGGGHYSVRPTSIYYTGDGSGVIGKLRPRGGETGPGRGSLRWRTWNRRRAAATGTVWLKLGTPIATSPFTRFAVSITATRVRKGHFTRMTLHYRLHGRRVTDVRCLPDRRPPQPPLEWSVLILGRC